jgi:hypothetical protein
MKKLVFAVLLVSFFVGCASVQDPCIDLDGRETYKSELKILPVDFPDELFIKWIPLRPEVYLADFDGDRKRESVYVVWRGKDGYLKAVMYVSAKNNKPRAWAFVEINRGIAEIVWVGKDAQDHELQYLQWDVHKYNSSTKS